MHKNCFIPKDYYPLLDVQETEKAIKLIKESFQVNLASVLNLKRITAPLFVKAGTGVNDDMNGTRAEIVQSLAKWKRLMLADLKFIVGEGIYTDMNAIRPEEILDNIHSLYVDQWDWERTIAPEERSIDFLKMIVRKIYQVLKETEWTVHSQFPNIIPVLSDEITFIHSEELYERYPDLPPFEREKKICQEKGSVFIIGIGATLKDGNPHDGRAPDYDDWVTETGKGRGLNGDIVIWYPVLQRAFEISSMGIRVDKHSLEKQLIITNNTERRKLFFHTKLINDELPLSIGGGIGQSRLCTFVLQKAHIGEVQSSIWPEEMIETCRSNNIFLL